MERSGGAGGWFARALVWALASALLLGVGFALFGAALVAVNAVRAGVELGSVQLAGWRALGTAIAGQALAPAWGLTLAGWLVLARIWPTLERSWRRLVPGLLGVSVLCFPLVARSFTMWTPTRLLDVVYTALLVSGSAAGALLLARRLIPALAPGAFARREGSAR